MQFKNIYNKTEEIETLKIAGRISARILKQLKQATIIGATPAQINDLAHELCQKESVEPSFKGVTGDYMDFPGNLCICVNDVTLHAIPSSVIPFKSGDIVKLDFGIVYKGFVTDHCVSVGLGELTKEEKLLVSTARLCVEEAVKEAIVGKRVGDISAKLQAISDLENFDYVKNYAGHGVGKLSDGGLHMSPSIPAYGNKGTGAELVEGMTLCIENQLSLGSGKLELDKDGWTLRTVDGSKTAMFEHMVIVQKRKPIILTQLN